jgi:hypothetical protein
MNVWRPWWMVRVARRSVPSDLQAVRKRSVVCGARSVSWYGVARQTDRPVGQRDAVSKLVRLPFFLRLANGETSQTVDPVSSETFRM